MIPGSCITGRRSRIASALIGSSGGTWRCVVVVVMGDGTLWRPAPNPADRLPMPRPADAICL